MPQPTDPNPATQRRISSTPWAGTLPQVTPATVAPLLLVSGAAVGMYSVPRYHPLIVATYLALLVALAVPTLRYRAARRPRGQSPTGSPTGRRASSSPTGHRAAGATALAATALAVWFVPSFSYLSDLPANALRLTVALAAAGGAVAVAAPWRRGPDVALLLAGVAYAATVAAEIRLDPAPRIDVWYILQGAADGLARGEDLYRMVLVGPPGRMAAFTYLPGTAVLLAPGRWLLGDVRWMLAAVTLCISAAFAAFGSRATARSGPTDADMTLREDARRAGRVAGALVLLLPGTLTQVEQAWTEPLLLGCLTGAVLALLNGRHRPAVLGVALALASKQHIVLLLPVLAAWPRFGPRRTAAAALVAGVMVLPWFVADPAAMWHDAVSLLVGFPPLRFADTAYIAVLNEFGVQLPFWLTGAVVLTALAGAAVLVRRHDPDVAAVLRWCALVLFVANLVNKQAFYNQYWLVAGLVLASWAVPRNLPPPNLQPPNLQA